MTLSDRIKLIIQECNIKQVEFAESLGISANYVNLLVKGKKNNISDTLAKLIEETYGYSANWVMNGEGSEKISPSLSAAKAALLKKIYKMPDEEIVALLAFANSLDSVKKAFLFEPNKSDVSI
ncbi:MAG: helix-turn-helix domain-containing protein [Lachnospiraceae bacterium]|nr:helix-turn-helix domain-containing protein [Lachnospiraceae bacterium]